MTATFADDIFRCIFLNENIRMSIQFSLKYLLNGTIDSKSVFVQVMARRPTGDKPLPEPMLARLYAALGENEFDTASRILYDNYYCLFIKCHKSRARLPRDTSRWYYLSEINWQIRFKIITLKEFQRFVVKKVCHELYDPYILCCRI